MNLKYKSIKYKSAVLIAGLALGATPALASANGSSHHTTTASSKAKAYGKYCKGVSHTKLSGDKQTQFAMCVTDMAKLANGSVKKPTTACQGLSKKKSSGTKGHSAYSLCVSGAAKLHKSEKA